jgi:hypothetical protein
MTLLSIIPCPAMELELNMSDLDDDDLWISSQARESSLIVFCMKFLHFRMVYPVTKNMHSASIMESQANTRFCLYNFHGVHSVTCLSPGTL